MIGKWPTRFLSIAYHISNWSKDPSTKVGAVITTPDNVMIASGYNGFPRKTRDDHAIYKNRNRKYKRIIHAEKNAMMFARRDLNGCFLYVTLPPCSQCAAMIIQCGIKRVYTIEPTKDQIERWGDDIKETQLMFKEAEVRYMEYGFDEFSENVQIHNSKKW